MNRFSIPVFLLLLSFCQNALAQTEEPIHYKITMPTGADLTLEGTLTIPANAKKAIPVVLIIAGSGPTDRNCNNPYGMKPNTYKMLADSLVNKGIAVARYDKRGSGTNLQAAMKTIKPAEHRFEFFVSDAIGFINQLKDDKRFSTIIIAGHSEGSLVGMLAAEKTKADKFISIAGPGRNIADVLKDQLKAGLSDTLSSVANTILDSLKAGHTVKRINPFLMGLFNPGNQPGLISWMVYNPTTVIKQFSGPVLLINGKHDLQVSTKEAELLKVARPDATLILVDQMSHILKNAPLDRTENIKTYSDPSSPLTPGLVDTIAKFVKR
ncbi:alpha/beta hydrolase [Spirosoma fluviale]|uniref:Serine aminopeptidase S33 domain-containing protein n=1 Tax=Spirosoma fluviale TaxID=1597977 RepID=A0A286FF08_9BACT|nr:alpha/beta hydrolase [Spirosoma fluviale]SOD81827.1 hypothetical protein SAMN06269250_1927 [Spirosoma fluviale]